MTLIILLINAVNFLTTIYLNWQLCFILHFSGLRTSVNCYTLSMLKCETKSIFSPFIYLKISFKLKMDFETIVTSSIKIQDMLNIYTPNVETLIKIKNKDNIWN